MKFLLSIGLLVITLTSLHAGDKTVTVSIDTPNPGWRCKIQSAHIKRGQLLIICQLSHPGGISASVISKAKDSIQLPEKLTRMKREIYVLGKTWNWGHAHTAVTPTQLKSVLKGSKEVYKAMENKKTPMGDDSDFVGLSHEDAIKLAKKRKLRHRPVMIDGKSLPVTKDMRRDRVNFVIKNGIVVRVSRG